MLSWFLLFGILPDLLSAQVEEPGDGPMPLAPIARVLEDADGDAVPDRLWQTLRIRGLVTLGGYTMSDRYLLIFIQDPTGGIGIYQRRPEVVPALGDVIEVVGKLDRYRGAPQLQEARIEIVGHSDGVEPKSLSLSEAASWKRYGQLVRVEGTLGRFAASGPRLVPLRSDDAVIQLYFPALLGRLVETVRFPEGTRIAVTGVVTMFSDPPHDDGFRIVVRDLDEMVVVAPPPARWLGWLKTGVVVFMAFAAGLAIGVPVLRRRSERRQRTLAVMNDLSTTILDPRLDAKQVAELSARILAERGLVKAAAVHLIGTHQELELSAAVGIPEGLTADLEADEVTRLLWARAQSGELVRPSDLARLDDSAALDRFRRSGLHLMDCVTLSGRNRPVGILCAFSDRPGRTPAQRKILRSAAKLTAVAVENIGMFERSERDRIELKELAHTDDLTGLYNRRFLDEYCRIQVAITRRQASSMAFLMIDIDHFKPINDTYGHEVGDRVLRRVGRRLRESTRAGDLPVRYGGEEFLVVIPATETDHARLFAERLREEVAAMDFRDLEEVADLKLTVSIGIALFPDHGSSEVTVLRACDEALYRAKDRGRNRVVVAD